MDAWKLAQITLDLPKLQPYFHVEERPARSPLVVVAEGLPPFGARLTKFRGPVVMKHEAELRVGEPFFRFKKIAIDGERAAVDFEYPPEGLAGRATFVRSSDGWVATESTFRER